MTSEVLDATQVDDHFVIAVLPFFHDLAIGGADATLGHRSVRSIDASDARSILGGSGKWVPWLARCVGLPAELGPSGVFDDSHFFLPHVRETLFPEFHSLPVNSDPTLRERIAYDDHAPERVLQRTTALEAAARDRPLELWDALRSTSLIHLTLRRDVCETLASWQLVTGKPGDERESVTAALMWCDVLLFSYGVGQLVLALRAEKGERPAGPGYPAPTTLGGVDRLRRLVSLVQPRYLGDTGVAKVRLGPVPDRTIRISTLLDYLLDGLAGPPLAGATADIADFARGWESAVASPARIGEGHVPYTVTRSGQVHSARMFTYVYVRPGSGHDPDSLGITGWKPSACFRTALEQLGVEAGVEIPWLRSETSAPDQSFALAPEWVRAHALGGHVFCRYTNWWAHAYDRSLVAFATRPDHFVSTWEYGVTRSLYHDYLWLFIHVVFVRSALTRFVERMQSCDRDSGDSLASLREVHEEFLRFRRRHGYPRVSPRDQAAELQALFHRSLDVDRDYAFVEQTLDDVMEAVESRNDRERARALDTLSVVVAPLALIFSACSMVMLTPWSAWQQWTLFAGLSLALGVMWIRRRQRTTDALSPGSRSEGHPEKRT